MNPERGAGANLLGLEEAIGYRFNNAELLTRALTHSSHRGESGFDRVPDADNEQFEFLGDAVLGLVVSEHVIRSCPDLDEGRLSNVKSRLVNRAHLADVARHLNLGSYLVMGRAEERSGGRDKASLLANAFEALLAAVYLEGGIESARDVVLRHVVGNADLRALSTEWVNNVKTTLEMLARSRDLPRPEYLVKAENSGFPQMFSAEVRVGQDLRTSGRGTSKKSAELEAARKMLDQLSG